MLSELFTSVADALISYAIDKLDPAERIKSWLKQDPARIAFQKALARAYSAFARQYPEYTSFLFDQSFLSKEALPELSKLLTRSQHPDPALLAQAWGQSIGADADFAQAATKPASYFIERLEAELKAEPALQALFDSRALDSLPKLEAEIQKLASELKRGLDTALKAASDYQKVTLHITGDVKDSNIIIGDNNVINKYYYSGDFVSLNEYYIPPDGVFQRVRVDEFVGRAWLTAKVDAFLNDPNQKSGAFLLVGDAGVGKTAFMAHLVKERRYLHLFAEQVPGQAMLQRALQSLGSQLVTRYQIDPYKDRDTLNVLAGFPDFLERLLRLAASTLTEGEKIVIVCDALDEAGVFPDHFVFGLPKELPDGVYLILSQRPVNTKLPNFEPLRFDLEAQGEDNLQDMENYLSAVAKRPVVAGQIRTKDYSEDFFIQTLKEKSLGVWMYLHYVIKEIERGQRAPLDLENLPKGLVGYYADYWDNWRSGRKGSDAAKWDSLYAPLLTTLAAAQEAITAEKLIEWADVQASPSEVTRLMNESWGSFITKKEEKSNTVYTLYHQSLRDFITGKVEDIKKLPPTYASLVNELSKKKVEAHQRIVNAFEAECKGEWEELVEQDYPRLHLTAHLNGAKEYKKLTDMLTEGNKKIMWAETREKKEETYAGYLNDLTYVWDYTEREKNYALAIRCMLIENSIHSLASNISPKLLAELAKTGLWSYARCLSLIRQITSDGTKTDSLELLAPSIPSELHQEALSILQEVKNEGSRARGLIALIPYLNDILKHHILSVIYEIRSENVRSDALTILAPHLNNNLKSKAIHDVISIVSKFENINTRVYAICELIPILDDDLKKVILEKILFEVNAYKDSYSRGLALTTIAQYYAGDEKAKILNDAFSDANKIKNVYYHSRLMAVLISKLDGDLKITALDNIAVSLQKIRFESSRAEILEMIAPYINDELKTKFLILISEVEDVQIRIYVLCRFVPFLDNKLKNNILKEALSFASGIQNKNEGLQFLTNLLPYFNNELRRELLEAAFSFIQEIEDDYARALAIIILGSYISKEQKVTALKIILSTLNNINDIRERINCLIAIAPYLNSELIKEVLVFVYEVKNADFFGEALVNLFSHLDSEQKNTAIYAISKIDSETLRSKNLIALTPLLDEEQKKIIISVAHDIKDASARANVFETLTPHLNKELVAKMISDTKDSIDGSFGNKVPTEITLPINFSINREKEIAFLHMHFNSSELKRLFSELGEIEYINLEKHINSLIKLISQNNRRDGYVSIPVVTPALIHFRGPEIADELYRAIQDTARWWP